jgi:AAA15 family ATPase/GTPase
MNKPQYIKIKNFRCFKELEVNGFKRVNLIGGKNNAGKTSLLEALLIYFYPIPQSILALKRIRKESNEAIKKKPKDAWNNFFYNQNMENFVSINGYFESLKGKLITMTVSQSLQHQIFDDDNDNKKFFDSISQGGSPVATLEIQQKLDEEQSIKRNLVASHAGLMSDFPDGFSIPLVASSFCISNTEIAEQYDEIRFDGKSEEIIKILKILDPSITGLDTYSFIEPTLYIQTKTQPRGLPISLFGDAIYRVTTIILELLNKEHNILFIDEIENGIHYTNQQSFWQGLFTLAEELDTLIFATTHSLEMIKAFAEAGKNFSDQGAYFELAYSPRTDNIVAINRDIDLLEYALEHGKAIRGE